MEIIFFNVDHITSVYWPSNLILYLVCDFLAVNTILIWKRFQPHKHYITVFIFFMFRCVWLLYFYFEILSFSCNRICILILLVYCITIYHYEIYYHDQSYWQKAMVVIQFWMLDIVFSTTYFCVTALLIPVCIWWMVKKSLKITDLKVVRLCSIIQCNIVFMLSILNVVFCFSVQ